MSAGADGGGWLEIELVVPAAEAEALGDALTTAGALAVTLADAADDPVLEPGPGETPLWRANRVIGLFPGGSDPALLQAALATAWARPLPPLVLRPLAEQEWARAWMKRFRPMRFGRRLWVVPSTHAAPPGAEVSLHLDPGLAFGTGTHPSTALCLEWLDAAELGGVRVLDYGCGSGILAIAAALLGAGEVVAVDNDPQALVATRDNAARNGVADRIRVLPADAPGLAGADVVVANILASVLEALAPRLKALVRPGGRLVLAGILAPQAARVRAAYAPACAFGATAARDGWARLEARCHGPGGDTPAPRGG